MTPVTLAARSLDTGTITIFLPFKLANGSNRREHWSKRSARARMHRENAMVTVARAITVTIGHLRGWTTRIVGGKTKVAAKVDLAGPVEVVLCRMSPRKFDSHDGLTTAFKAVADGVADGLGLADDSSAMIRFEYAWRKVAAKDEGIEIQIRLASSEVAT